MAILDIQVVATSLPTIQDALAISPDAMSWIQTAYLIAEITAIPLTGWLYSSAAGVPTVPFGISALQLPDLLDRNKELAGSLRFLHVTLNFSLAALVGLHVAAALKHQFFDRDGLIGRMNPF